MKTTNLKFFGGGKFVLALGTVVFILAACKVADAGATADDASSNPPPVPPTTYTITVDANTGSLGSFKSKTVNNGDKLAALVGDQLPSKNDYEIAYWSTSPDTYSDLFEFDKSQITKNTTIYPHWRYTLAKVRSLLNGDWDFPFFLAAYRIRSDQLNSSYCQAQDNAPLIAGTGSSVVYNIGNYPSLVTFIKDLTNFPTNKQSQHDTTVNNVTVTVSCLNNQLITLNSYAAKDNDDINVDYFITLSATNRKLILRSSDYYTNNFIIEVSNNTSASLAWTNGTHPATRLP